MIDLGGNDEMTFESLGNPILKRYSQPTQDMSKPKIERGPPLIPITKTMPISSSGSSTSIADIYHTAQNTPSASRRQSLTAGMGLHMTKAPLEPIDTNVETEQQITQTSSRQSSPGGTLRKIKSLSDFHLYLSPSRLAHLDVLSDSDSDSDIDIVEQPKENIGLMPRQRPQMNVLGKVAGEDARSYSGRLQAHHAKVLDGYKESRMVEAFPSRTADSVTVGFGGASVEVRIKSEEAEAGPSRSLKDRLGQSDRPSTPCSATTPGPPVYPTTTTAIDETEVQPISAFQSDLNPYYGYPAILTGTTVRPRYPRNRKRDLVKTLLFLFILRIQSWRDAFERFLGLNNLGTWSLTRSLILVKQDPGTGLVHQGELDGKVVKRVEKDWIWMAITFILLRGTWARILGGPLDAIGLGGVRDMLGLV